jgi:hypothetical protein
MALLFALFFIALFLKEKSALALIAFTLLLCVLMLIHHMTIHIPIRL